MTANANPAPAAPAAKIIPINDIETIRAAGLHYPETVDGWRWLWRTRHKQGLERAFIQIGRRVMVDVDAYVEAMRARAANAEGGETAA